jgi:alpha-N-acetylglucosamine transferase
MPQLWNWASIGVLHYQYEKPWEKVHPKTAQLQPLIDLWHAFFTGENIPEIASLPNPPASSPL